MNLGRIGANAVIVFFLFWPFYDLVTGEESFPFAPYVMYCDRFRLGDFSSDMTSLFGVFDHHEELPVSGVGVQNRTQIVHYYYDLKSKSDGISKIETAMRETLKQCNEDPGCGATIFGTGEIRKNLLGLRYYQDHYDSIDSLRAKRPDRRELIAEVELKP